MATAPWVRGTTFHGPAGIGSNITASLPDVQLEGLEVEFDHVDPTTKKVLSGRKVKGRIVRWTGADEANPAGKAVKWATGYRDRRVVKSTDDMHEPAGLIDDFLTQTLRQNDLVFIAQRGPSRHMTHTTAAAASIGERLYTAAADGTLYKRTDAEANGAHALQYVVGVATQDVASTANDSSLRGIDLLIA